MQAIRPGREQMADTGDQLLVSGGEPAQAHWPSPMTPLSNSSDHIHTPGHEHGHHHDDHHRRSVLAKVKEKAKKWRGLLTKKKHTHDAEGNSTPTTPSSMEDVDDVDRDPEYHGAPMYESERAPKMYRERASKLQASVMSPITPTSVLNRSVHSPQTPPTPAQKPEKEAILCHHGAVPNSTVHVSPAIAAPVPVLQHSHETKMEPKLQHLDRFRETSADHSLIPPTTANTLATVDHNGIKTLTETVTEILAPAYNMVSDATSKMAAKIQSPMAGDETGAKMMWDKGVSVKEYLLQKLEPGAEVKALSEVITEAISPRKAGAGELEDIGVVEKVKGAVSALLGKEEQPLDAVHHKTTSRPLFKSLEESSILSPMYKDGVPIQPAEVLTTNYAIPASSPSYKYYAHAKSFPRDAHGAMIAEFKRKYMDKDLSPRDGQGVSNQASASKTASKGTHGVPEHSHVTSIFDSVHARDSPPLPVSTPPLLSSPTSVSTNPSTYQNFSNPFEEVEETSGRRLQAYAN